MNFLGKVFVMLIVVMSLIFLGLSMAVYSTHKNWKEKTQALNTELETARTENEQLKTAHNLKVQELDREKTAAEQQIAKLETERSSLVATNAQIQKQLDVLEQNQRGQLAAVASTQDLNQKLTAEVTGLRTQVRTEEQARDDAFTKALNATEQLHQSRNKYESAEERSRQLTAQNASMRMMMKENGMNPDTPPGAIVPTVNGVVSQVRRNAGAQLVEFTIGADDGLKAGNTVEVYRGTKYLGRLDIIQTSPDKSVGRVDRRYLQGQIQEGDRVATRLKL
jgi:hypothetical protein